MIGGVVTILIGVALLLFVVPNTVGEWAQALAIGAFITGAVQIFIGVNKQKK